jgi:hypothetical protein
LRAAGTTPFTLSIPTHSASPLPYTHTTQNRIAWYWDDFAAFNTLTHTHTDAHMCLGYTLSVSSIFCQARVPADHSLSHVAGISAVTLKAAALSAAAWRGDFH